MASTVPMPLRAKNYALMPFSLQIESHDSSADTSRGHRTQRTRQENAAIRGNVRRVFARLVGGWSAASHSIHAGFRHWLIGRLITLAASPLGV